MARAVHDSNQLRNGKEEVDELGQEEEHQCLGEVTLDGGNGQSHAGEISEGISHKGLRWVRIVVCQRQNTS